MFNSPNKTIAYGAGGGGGIVGVSTFTTSGTWVKADREAELGVKINRVIVEVQGAGGGGSRHDSNANLVNSGGAGGYAKKLLDVSSVVSSNVTIGFAGDGAASQGVGLEGGASFWEDGVNTNVVGNGGGGSVVAQDPAYGTSGEGGTASGGDLNFTGMNGSTKGVRSGANGMPEGGNSFYGYGGWGTYGDPSTSQPDGNGYGSGGMGNYTKPAGNGAPGIVIVTEIA